MDLQPLSPKQALSIAHATGRINLWHGAVRSGKSVATDIAAAEFACTGPPGDFVFVGKTHDTLRRNVLLPMVDIFGEAAVKIWSGKREAEVFGRRVHLVGANDERAEMKIRGMTAAGALGDEITLWPESFYDMLMTRLSVPGARFFGTTNPDNPKHWLKEKWIDQATQKGVRHWQFKIRDNTALTDEYIRAQESYFQGLWYKRFILGDWVVAEGAIWDMFRDSGPGSHVISGIPRGVAVRKAIAAIDYGTANPFVALLIALGSDGNLYVLDELRWDSEAEKTQKTDEQYSQMTIDWARGQEHRPEQFVIDPSAKSFFVQLAREGVACRGANNEVLDGIRTVGTHFGCGQLYILEHCHGLIDEILGYLWDSKAQQRGEDKPIKRDDHGPDALRYGVMALTHQVGATPEMPSQEEPPAEYGGNIMEWQT